MAGVSAGVLWGMTAGYARRMVPDSLKGKAMAVAMVGTPVALALGVPIGSFLSSYVGWRLIFGMVSLLTVALIVWVLWKMPDFAGEPAGERLPPHKVFLIPGVRPILFVVLAWMLAHNILYTYISPYLAQTVFANRVDLILLIFGFTSIVGIWLTGMLIDRFLRRLVIISLAAFALASVVMGIGTHQPMIIILGIMIWGITFGGPPRYYKLPLLKPEAKVQMSPNRCWLQHGIWRLAEEASSGASFLSYLEQNIFLGHCLSCSFLRCL